jgi:hypothetical protein
MMSPIELSTEPFPIYLVASAATIQWYEGKTFALPGGGSTLRIMHPLYEPEGVLNRRGAIVHPFSGRQMAMVQRTAKKLGHDYDALEALPDDWRTA